MESRLRRHCCCHGGPPPPTGWPTPTSWPPPLANPPGWPPSPWLAWQGDGWLGSSTFMLTKRTCWGGNGFTSEFHLKNRPLAKGHLNFGFLATDVLKFFLMHNYHFKEIHHIMKHVPILGSSCRRNPCEKRGKFLSHCWVFFHFVEEVHLRNVDEERDTTFNWTACFPLMLNLINQGHHDSY